MSNTPQNIAFGLLTQLMSELEKIVVRAKEELDFKMAGERLDRWKNRAVNEIREKISPIEAENLEKKRKGSFLIGQPLRNLVDEVDMYRGFLMALGEEINEHPMAISLSPEEKKGEQDVLPKGTETTRNVFIVHGHDELNLLKLKDLLRERWHLIPIVMNKKAGKGRTLLEKFEEEAQAASYAIALFTPDDVIDKGEESYFQARPNTIFELGWFFGRLGRDKVCLLVKEGTETLTDLEGLSVIFFKETVEEKISELEEEFRAAKII
jgi:predicted nucleotide-binding protein